MLGGTPLLIGFPVNGGWRSCALAFPRETKSKHTLIDLSCQMNLFIHD
jgi:hypothetical protein